MMSSISDFHSSGKRPQVSAEARLKIGKMNTNLRLETASWAPYWSQ
jgi:hypothetical protein